MDVALASRPQVMLPRRATSVEPLCHHGASGYHGRDFSQDAVRRHEASSVWLSPRCRLLFQATTASLT
jgi:hypothetical protein